MDLGESGMDDLFSKLGELGDDKPQAPPVEEDKPEDKKGMDDLLGKLDELNSESPADSKPKAKEKKSKKASSKKDKKSKSKKDKKAKKSKEDKSSGDDEMDDLFSKLDEL